MPGLLQTPEHNLRSWKVFYAVFAEFIGVAVFSLYGSATSLLDSPISVTNNAFGNGAALAVIVYITANISGGHINPAVTLSTLLTGHIGVAKAVLYICAQVAGGIFGSLFLAGLLNPNVKVGTGEFPAGCFARSHITGIQLFGWEAVMTFVLVSTVYAVAIGEPHFGIMGPLVVGLALFVAVEAGGQYTGGGLNPARVLGPACVFSCSWSTAWIYVLGELLGALIAGAFSVPLYGKGKEFGKLFEGIHIPGKNKGRQSQRGKRGADVNSANNSQPELDPVTYDTMTTGSFASNFPAPASRVVVVHEPGAQR